MTTKHTRGKIKNILVIKLRYLGDVVITTPVFEALRHYYPDASIAALVNKGTEAMLTHNPNVDRIFVLERDDNPIVGLKKQIKLITELRKLHFDLALELTNNDRGATYSFLSGAKRRLGFRSRKRKKLDRHLLYTDLVVPTIGLHIVDRQLEMTRYLGSDPVTTEPTLFWSKEEESSCQEILEKQGSSLHERFAVLHPTSYAIYKEWNIENCSLLCDYLFDQWKVRPILVCGPAAGEMDFTNQVARISKSPLINLGSQLSLRQLVVLIANAVLFVGVDSGPMHIAEAIKKTPVVAIYGPQDPRRWGPRGEEHIVLQKSWECVPCRKKGCYNNGSRSRCLKELAVEEVLPAIDSQMKRILSYEKLSSINSEME